MSEPGWLMNKPQLDRWSWLPILADFGAFPARQVPTIVSLTRILELRQNHSGIIFRASATVEGTGRQSILIMVWTAAIVIAFHLNWLCWLATCCFLLFAPAIPNR
jgi:hypothetical protein